jgi:hypothetical protein
LKYGGSLLVRAIIVFEVEIPKLPMLRQGIRVRPFLFSSQDFILGFDFNVNFDLDAKKGLSSRRSISGVAGAHLVPTAGVEGWLEGVLGLLDFTKMSNK